MSIASEQALHYQMETRKLASIIALCWHYLQDKQRKELREVLEDAYQYVCKEGHFVIENYRQVRFLSCPQAR